jgi:hypothetical protein
MKQLSRSIYSIYSSSYPTWIKGLFWLIVV